MGLYSRGLYYQKDDLRLRFGEGAYFLEGLLLGLLSEFYGVSFGVAYIYRRLSRNFDIYSLGRPLSSEIDRL